MSPSPHPPAAPTFHLIQVKGQLHPFHLNKQDSESARWGGHLNSSQKTVRLRMFNNQIKFSVFNNQIKFFTQSFNLSTQ